MAEHVVESELALIVGAARSGTTLLRLILDAHPEIGCPAEAGLPSLMSHMVGVWATIDADVNEDTPASDPGTPGPETVDGHVTPADQAPHPETVGDADLPAVPESARAWVREATTTVMRRYCARGDKRLYVDKSLDSVHHLALVRELFPKVRCLLVFRHVMDTIASGIEASPWGFQAYGYAPYLQTSPGNSVAALARYWLDHVDAALAWEQRHPESCQRVRYEDLVADAASAVESIEQFLGVRTDLEVLKRAFDRQSPRGPGDYKVEHTTAVHAAAVGHGKRVPVTLLPPPLLAAVNERLEVLGYPALSRAWNTAERPVHSPLDNVWTQRLQSLMDQARPPTSIDHLGAFAIVAEDHLALRWLVDPETGTITQGDGDVEAVLTGTTEDLVLMLTDAENLGVLLRAGRIRHVVADEDHAAPDLPSRLDAIMTTLRSCLPR